METVFVRQGLCLNQLRNIARFVRMKVRDDAKVKVGDAWLTAQDALNTSVLWDGVASQAFEGLGIRDPPPHKARLLGSIMDALNRQAAPGNSMQRPRRKADVGLFPFDKHTVIVRKLSGSMDEAGIRAVLTRFGRLIQVSVRSKGGTEYLSWALVTFQNLQNKENLLLQEVRIDDHVAVIEAIDATVAMNSTGQLSSVYAIAKEKALAVLKADTIVDSTEFERTARALLVDALPSTAPQVLLRLMSPTGVNPASNAYWLSFHAAAPVTAVAHSRTGQAVFVGAGEAVDVFSVQQYTLSHGQSYEGKWLRRLPQSGLVRSISVNRHHGEVAVASTGGVRLYKMHDGAAVTLCKSAEANCVQWAPDGHRLGFSVGGSVQLWKRTDLNAKPLVVGDPAGATLLGFAFERSSALLLTLDRVADTSPHFTLVFIKFTC